MASPRDLVNQMSRMVSQLVRELIELILWAAKIIISIFIVFLNIIITTVKLVILHIPKLIAPMIPKRTSSRLNQQLIYAGVEMTSEEVISITLVYSVVVTVISYLTAVLLEVAQPIPLLVVTVSFASVWGLPFILLNLLASRRAEAVETVLPDVLSMIGQNMSAGMTSSNALWSVARPEFGPLATEIQDVAKATLTGIPLTDALVGMTNHIKSSKLSRSVRLIIQGMKSGGDLPAVLQAISQDMRREYNLKKQMAAETNAHALFILFAIMVGAPLLFSVSYQFIMIFSTMMEKLNIEELGKEVPQGSGMISLSPLSITPEFFQLYAIGILFISSVSGALLVGMLRTGNIVSGVPNIPVFVVISIGMFMLMKYGLGLFFSQIVTF
ncbi:MAG: hypothetical protein GF416_00370 [Candidatus Altiarchaeales archaeon]|nr:hypothetical protein [Candidatus Altiarchaeales archaeon]MBD3415574.1 hypothetical protein [Candidatus Altiarchaeales archaeon]